MFKSKSLVYAFYIIWELINNVSCKQNPSVIIIGAGVSGIAAASKLLANNITQVIVLEAEDRIGGRVNSVKFGEAFVEMGAEWCHGENVVYDFTKDFDILKKVNSTNSLVYSDGTFIDEDLSEELFTFAEDLKNLVYEAIRKDVSMGEQFMTVFDKIILKKYNQDEKNYKIVKDAMAFLENYYLDNEGASSWYNVSYLSDFAETAGDQALNWNGRGYKTILEILLKIYPDSKNALPFEGKILFNKEVTKVSWVDSLNNAVKLKCSDGSSYTADYVIFTPSLGVIKAMQDDLFEPRLPSEKQAAVKSLGFGCLMKVILKYSEAWWNANEQVMYYFMWNSDEKLKIANEFKEGPIQVIQYGQVLKYIYMRNCRQEIKIQNLDVVIHLVRVILPGLLPCCRKCHFTSEEDHNKMIETSSANLRQHSSTPGRITLTNDVGRESLSNKTKWSYTRLVYIWRLRRSNMVYSDGRIMKWIFYTSYTLITGNILTVVTRAQNIKI